MGLEPKWRTSELNPPTHQSYSGIVTLKQRYRKVKIRYVVIQLQNSVIWIAWIYINFTNVLLQAIIVHDPPSSIRTPATDCLHHLSRIVQMLSQTKLLRSSMENIQKWSFNNSNNICSTCQNIPRHTCKIWGFKINKHFLVGGFNPIEK